MSDLDEIFITQSSFCSSLSLFNIEELLEPDVNVDSILDDLGDIISGDNKNIESTTRRRGIQVVSDREVQERNAERIPENTRKATKWCTRVWDDWAEERNTLPIEPNDNFVIAPSSSILKTVADYELSF